MPAEVVQSQYEDLKKIADRFGRHAEAQKQLQQRVARSMSALQSGWQGKGSAAFFGEMNGKVLPVMKRMEDALRQAQVETNAIGQLIKVAEEDASAPFKAGGAGKAPGGDPKSPPDVATMVPGTLDEQRQAYTVSAPQEVKSHPFRSGAADALRYDIKVGDRTIPVFVPKTDAGKNGNLHSIDEVAKGLAALPEQNRNLVKSVQINPDRNPDDTYWEKQYNTPGFRSYMTAGADGQVDIYPTTTKIAQEYVDKSMIHETGHIWSGQNWGNDNDKRWDDWNKAIKSDPGIASKYAKSSSSEDFSEALVIYQLVRGTPAEAGYRLQMPERFKILDKHFAKGK